MTPLASRLYEPLAPYKAAIAGSAEMQSVAFVESTWRAWLDLAAVDSALVNEIFLAIGPNSVSREQLRNLAAKADTADAGLGLLIAVLVWGGGKKNARMRDPIIKTLTHAERDRVLAETAALAGGGRAAEAYNSWTLPGLRAAFFTKWLWAASSLTPSTCCLVQDRLVWKSLAALGWNSFEAAGSVRDWGSCYAAYVEDVHLCADGLGGGVSAEDVEYTLFWINGDIGKLASSRVT